MKIYFKTILLIGFVFYKITGCFCEINGHYNNSTLYGECSSEFPCPIENENDKCAQLGDERAWRQFSTSYFANYCQPKKEANGITSAIDCSDRYLGSLPCLDDSIKELIFNGNELGSSGGLSNFTFLSGGSITILELASNGITRLPPNVFQNLVKLNRLSLSHNAIQNLDENVFQNLTRLEELSLDDTGIVNLPSNVFRNLGNLKKLWLNNNGIRYLDENTFQDLNNLEFLDLSGNNITNFPSFQNLPMLRILSLSNNQITKLPAQILKNSQRLDKLDLENNAIKVIDKYSFSNLIRLRELNLKNNQIGYVDKNIFVDLKKLKLLKADEFRFCCLKKDMNCTPSNEFSSCDNLIKNELLRMFVWNLGLVAIVANIIVIYGSLKYKIDETNKTSIFLMVNLATSGLIMGVYLLMIAMVDAIYSGEYYLHELSWRKSNWCDWAGVLSTLSSESTVFILTIMSVDRLITIMFPLRSTNSGFNRMKISMIVVWIFCVVIALVPHQLFQISYFKNFLGRSNVCLALHLTNESPGGWEYSVFIFTILNAILLVVIVICYTLMYFQLSKRKHETTPSNQHSDTVMTFRMSLLVLADVACWILILILGIQSVMGYALSPDVYPWIAVFLFPLNAALNPILFICSSIPLMFVSECEEYPETVEPSYRCRWQGGAATRNDGKKENNLYRLALTSIYESVR